MPLQTETITVDDALAEIDEQIKEIGDTLADLKPGTDRYEALLDRSDTLEYRANGLIWMRDEAGWGDFEVELGALSAGEKAKMHRQANSNASTEEMKLWWVAAGSEVGPHVADSLSQTFETLAADCHDGFVQWAEAKINELSTPGNATRRLQTYLSETQPDETSAQPSTSTSSSSSGSDAA